VSENRAVHPVATMCRVLGVSPSGYHAWTRRTPSRRAREDSVLRDRIVAIHAAAHGTYGAPRIDAELAEEGIHVGRKRVARLMRAAGLAGVSRRRFVTTTVRDGARPAPDLVERTFTADRLNVLWVADITYVPTWAGFVYLAVVLDAFSRRIVGWSMATSLATKLVLDALDMALWQRRPQDVIHHSDQGSQYTSLAFGNRCREAGVRPSMGSVGDAYDNCDGRELLCHPRVGTSRAPSLQDPRRGEDGDLRVYRELLQSASSALCPRLSVTGRLRAPPLGRGLASPARTRACRRARARQGAASKRWSARRRHRNGRP
jgi:putative transposase